MRMYQVRHRRNQAVKLEARRRVGELLGVETDIISQTVAGLLTGSKHLSC